MPVCPSPFPVPSGDHFITPSIGSTNLTPESFGSHSQASRTKKKSKAGQSQHPKNPRKQPASSSSNLTSAAQPAYSIAEQPPTSNEIHPTFPNEIFGQIVRHLSGSHSTLYSWCLVSKTFYQMGFPIMSRHLRLSPWKTDSGEGRDVLDPNKEKVGRLSGKRKTRHDSPSDSLKAPENVRILTLREHPLQWCQQGSIVPLVLPRLQTVHLHVEDRCSIERGSQVAFAHLDLGYPPKTCRFLAALLPTNLVFRFSSIRHTGKLPLRSTLKWRTDAEHLYIVAPSSNPLLEVICLEFRLFQWHAPSAKQIHWIFDPSISPTDSASKPRDRLTPAQFSGLGHLARVFEGIPITIVNIASVLRNPATSNNQITQAEVERVVEREVYRASNYNWHEQRKKARMETIKFISLREYLDTEDWWETFEPDEVERWITHTPTESK
ncbi:hypothetical protein IAT40_004608 [Kwoniella sp. CBS 6097]